MLTQAAGRSHPIRRPLLPTYNEAPPRIAIETDPLAQQIQLMGAAMSFARNAEIFGESEPADYLYKVIGGAVRTYKILGDGRRQVGGFYLPGDIFGLEFTDEHTLAAEAISNVKLLVIKRSALA